MHILTDEERKRFAAYCYQEAQTCRAMAEQIESLGHKQLAQREKQKAGAFALVSAEVDPASRETMSVRG